MAINELSPGFVKVYYSSPDTEEHVQTLQLSEPIYPIIPGEEPSFQGRQPATQVTFSTFAAEYATQLLPLLPPSATVQRMEYWSKPMIDDDPLYVYTHDISLPGTGPSPGVRATQIQMTLRSQGGGLLRVVLLGVSDDYPDKEIPPYTQSGYTALAEFLTGNSVTYPNNLIQARDNTWPLLSLGVYRKTNDVLRAKYLDL